MFLTDVRMMMTDVRMMMPRIERVLTEQRVRVRVREQELPHKRLVPNTELQQQIHTYFRRADPTYQDRFMHF